MDIKLEVTEDEYILPGSPPASERFEDIDETPVSSLLPDKSRALYEISYNRFLTWQRQHHTTSFSQRVLMEYFTDLSKKWKSSTLWSEFSKVGKMLKIEHNVEVGQYRELKSFLKKLSIGYKAKKCKALTANNVERYWNEAPDHTCLATKVAMIFGVLGACRREELTRVELSHLRTYHEPEDTRKKDPILVVRVPNPKTNEEREFTVKGKLFEYYQKYIDLRPTVVPHNRFFVTYRNGKCTMQPIGEKKFAAMPKQVAEFLKLPHPELYTAHAFRRTSAALLAESEADVEMSDSIQSGPSSSY